MLEKEYIAKKLKILLTATVGMIFGALTSRQFLSSPLFVFSF